MRLGDFEVAALRDAEGSFATMREAFGLESDETWVLPVHVYLLRVSGVTIVVDTGIGPPPRDFMPQAQASLPERLAENGVAADDVELVVLTHLHVDHVGWNHLFERARIVASRRDYDYFTETRGDVDYFRREVQALVATGRIELLDEIAEVADGVVAEPIPGHTPGHTGVAVHARDEHLRLLGDLAVHELQLADPAVRYFADADPVAAEQARRSVLKTAVAAGSVVGLSHLPSGLGRVRIEGGGFAWEPVG